LKKMERIIVKYIYLIVLASLMAGCTGVVTGHQYTAEDVTRAREAYIKIRDAYGVIEAEKKRIESDGFATTNSKQTN